jgi:polysaccharide export outer membrane protein
MTAPVSALRGVRPVTVWRAILCVAVASGALLAAAENSTRKGEGAKVSVVREAAVSDYILQPQDVLRVQVFQEEDINKQGEVSISQEHTIVLPLIKTVNLKGKTQRQAEELIRDLYNKDFLVNPNVTVSVLKYAERSVNVLGQVNAAGRVQFPPEGRLTIVDAITLAGGQNRLADLKRVKLTRKNAGGDAITQEINVDILMKGGGGEPMLLEKGDVIFVPERTF